MLGQFSRPLLTAPASFARHMTLLCICEKATTCVTARITVRFLLALRNCPLATARYLLALKNSLLTGVGSPAARWSTRSPYICTTRSPLKAPSFQKHSDCPAGRALGPFLVCQCC